MCGLSTNDLVAALRHHACDLPDPHRLAMTPDGTDISRERRGPGLRGDREAIVNLLKRHVRWLNLLSSIQIKQAERIAPREWVVNAIVTIEPVEVNTDSGKPVSTIPLERDLSRFVLLKSNDGNEWVQLFWRDGDYRKGMTPSL